MEKLPTEVVIINLGEEKIEVELNDPLWLGNTIACYYKDHNPIFIIGPECILFIRFRATSYCLSKSYYWIRYFLPYLLYSQ